MVTVGGTIGVVVSSTTASVGGRGRGGLVSGEAVVVGGSSTPSDGTVGIGNGMVGGVGLG